MAGLAKRSRKNKLNKKTGRPRSKKRFSKSIQNHAPSMFVTILSRKGAARGGQVVKENSTPIKASQYDHTNDTYTKAPLNERVKTLSSGDRVHRTPTHPSCCPMCRKTILSTGEPAWHTSRSSNTCTTL